MSIPVVSVQAHGMPHKVNDSSFKVELLEDICHGVTFEVKFYIHIVTNNSDILKIKETIHSNQFIS